MRERLHPFDMSLRLWSDDVPLRGPLAEAGLDAAHLHVRGEPMAEAGALAGRAARRHYASAAGVEGRDGAEVEAWLAATMDGVAGAAALRAELRLGRVEGVLWVAILGRVPLDAPVIAPALAARAEDLGLRISLENYTRPDEEPFPGQVWIGAPALGGGIQTGDPKPGPTGPRTGGSGEEG